MDLDEFVPLTKATALAGVSLPTLKKRIRRGDLVTYASPIDGRLKLLRRDDIERLRQPTPKERGLRPLTAA